MDVWDGRLREALSGCYELDRLLGRGGSSHVFLAQDLKRRRSVAIKIPRKDVAACGGLDRFRREIRIAAHLRHPNILPLCDFRNSDGVAYYVMPYVGDETLWDQIRAGRTFDVAPALTITQGIARALAFAHEHGITHRDVSPANIFELDGHPLLFDFGIAAVRNEKSDLRPLTGPARCLGTPQYMSPEQTRGGETDGRSDQYSLACVLYEMVTGRPPFLGSDHALMIKHVHERPVPLSDRRSDMEANVSAAVSRALAKDPDDRFESVDAFACALTSGLASRPSRQRPAVAVASITAENGGPELERLGTGVTDANVAVLGCVAGMRVVSAVQPSLDHHPRDVTWTVEPPAFLEGTVDRAVAGSQATTLLPHGSTGHPICTGQPEGALDERMTAPGKFAKDDRGYVMGKQAMTPPISNWRVA